MVAICTDQKHWLSPVLKCLLVLKIFIIYYYMNYHYFMYMSLDGSSSPSDKVALRRLNTIDVAATGHKFNPDANLSQYGISNGNSSSKLKKIALWNKWVGSDTWLYKGFQKGANQMEIQCLNQARCILSYDRTKPLQYDAIMFNERERYSIPQQRQAAQVYVLFTWESPINGLYYYEKGSTFYNWTATYSQKSDIAMGYGSYFKLAQRNQSALSAYSRYHKKSPVNGTLRIFWVVSNCKARNDRESYVKELKKYAQIDVYGGCGERKCPVDDIDCWPDLVRREGYKFYLAFENSNCPHYLSDKPYRSLQSGAVPIVMGGTSTEEYKRALPPHSFIDVRDYKSPKELVKYLTSLDANDGEYYKYHAWHREYGVREHYNALPVICKVCESLYNSTMMKPRNVNWETFWDPRECDTTLTQRLLTH